MSCVVAVKNGNVCYVGGDSCGVIDASEIRIRKDQKVFKNKGIVIGFCGSVRNGQCLKPNVWKPPPKLNIEDIVFSIKDTMDECGGLLPPIEDTGENMGSIFVVSFKGKLYEVQGDFQYAEFEDDYTAIGAGKQFALGSLYETQKDYSITPKIRVIKALECSAYFSPFVRPPFIVFKTTGENPKSKYNES